MNVRIIFLKKLEGSGFLYIDSRPRNMGFGSGVENVVCGETPRLDIYYVITYCAEYYHVIISYVFVVKRTIIIIKSSNMNIVSPDYYCTFYDVVLLGHSRYQPKSGLGIPSC